MYVYLYQYSVPGIAILKFFFKEVVYNITLRTQDMLKKRHFNFCPVTYHQ